MAPQGKSASGSAAGGAVSLPELSHLIASIYDCALDPDLWDQTLGRIAATLECRTADLHLTDLRHNRLLVHRIVGVERYWVEQLRTKYLPEVNAVLGRVLTERSSLDEPLVVSRDIPQSVVDSSPYFQEALKGARIADIIQYFLMSTPTRFAGLGFGRDESQGVVTPREIEIGGLLLPHVRRAVTISDVLDARKVERTLMADTLDTLRCGVVLADGDGRIVHANRGAEDMLREGSLIRDTHGVLGATLPGASQEVQRAIRLAERNEAEIGKVGLAIRLSPDEAPEPRFAHVLPLSGGGRAGARRDAVAAVFISGQPAAGDDAAAAGAAFGLSPAETRLLAGLLAGATLAETAKASGIAHATAKSQLESIFQKTGTGRQAELMLLASRAASPGKNPGAA